MDKETLYNVVCIDCGSVFKPAVKSRLWWRAKRRADEGYLDAVAIPGVMCGCVKEKKDPDAPIRIFGYTDDLRDFDYPFHSTTEAIRVFRKLRADWSLTVFASGLSSAVEQRIASEF